MHKRNDTVQNFAARQCCLLGHPVSWTNCFDQCWTASHNWVIFFLTENSFLMHVFDDLFMKIIMRWFKNWWKISWNRRSIRERRMLIQKLFDPIVPQHCCKFSQQNHHYPLCWCWKILCDFFFENAQILTQFVVERVQYS